MPIFTYSCSKCGNNFRSLTEPGTEKPCPNCQTVVQQNIPSNCALISYEMKDKRRGTQTVKNVDRKLKKRMADHHDKYEVQDKIDKFGLEEATRHGWTKKAKKL